ncbi:MAG: tRNA dihydrouridine synthase DusB [Desulfobulbaceae bacterium]|nr:tRNA dihydrouridine synthase DusB [Desulfobulbaceae bacterium]
MRIGPLTLQNPFILAPLAGYTDLPFRILCREMGAGLCFSEMISSHGLTYGQKKTLEMLATIADERPVAFQLFGSDPEIMGRAAAFLTDYPIDFIDINMGCPVKKVVRKGSGAALMKDIQTAEAIIRSVVANAGLPVTVKFRSGWTHESINAESFARMAENAGASAVTIHSRTWSQGFGGTADWSIIRRVKEAVAIPVIGNGDILEYRDGLRMMEETGCEGVMIGRGALGNPWVFRKSGRPETLAQRMGVINRHIELIERYLPQRQALFKVKNNIIRYLTGLPGASGLRRTISVSPSIAEIRNLLDQAE